MPKKVFPIMPANGQIYSDDAGSQTQLNLNHLAESFQLADLLKQLGQSDVAEFVRPVHMIAGFKPAALISRLNEMAGNWDRACIACINSDRLPELIFYPCPNGVNQLVKLRVSGGHVLGLIGLNYDGSFTTSTENGPDQELRVSLLNAFARGCSTTPDYLAAEEILSLDTPENFTPDNLRTTLDRYTDICEQIPADIHSEITGAL